MRMTVVKTLDELVGEFLLRNTVVQRAWGQDQSAKHTLTIIGPRPSALPTVSMYFFRSRSRNSKTKYNF